MKNNLIKEPMGGLPVNPELLDTTGVFNPGFSYWSMSAPKRRQAPRSGAPFPTLTLGSPPRRRSLQLHPAPFLTRTTSFAYSFVVALRRDPFPSAVFPFLGPNAAAAADAAGQRHYGIAADPRRMRGLIEATPSPRLAAASLERSRSRPHVAPRQKAHFF